MSEDKHTSSGFFSGLFFGAAAGVASYFFLKTDEGKQARKRLSEEWEKAKQDLAQSGVIDDVTQSLPQTIQHTIQRIVEPHHTPPIKHTVKRTLKSEKTVEAVDVQSEEPVSELKTAPKATVKKKAPSTKKFKGT